MASCHLREFWSWPAEELIREVLALTEERGWRGFVYWRVYVVVGPCHSLQLPAIAAFLTGVTFFLKFLPTPAPALITAWQGSQFLPDQKSSPRPDS